MEIGLDARDSFCTPAALERGDYVHHEHAVLQDVLALLAHVPWVVATARHLNHAGKQNDGIGLALRLDEGEPHGLSLTKYFTAYYSSFALHLKLLRLAAKPYEIGAGEGSGERLLVSEHWTDRARADSIGLQLGRERPARPLLHGPSTLVHRALLAKILANLGIKCINKF